jgi:preprotein translocase subunit SecE
MALNREQKRQLKRAGDLDVEAADGGAGNGNGTTNGNGNGSGDDGDDGGSGRKGRATPTAKSDHKDERTSPRQFVKEVRSELRKVAWPTRSETLNYSLIVAIALVVMTTLIFGLDWVFSEVVLRIFDAK